VRLGFEPRTEWFRSVQGLVLVTGGADGKILRIVGKNGRYSKIIIWFRIEKTYVVFVIYTGACRICA
jgi:hypothetical protein